MTTVTVNRSIRPSIAVNQGSKSDASVVIRKGGDLTVQSLKNVDTTDLQDGYTLIYDEDTQKFVATPAGDVTINLVDGGSY